MIYRMTNLTNHKKIVLTKQIIDVIDTTCLGIFHWHQSIIYITGGNCTENIRKGAQRNRLGTLLKVRPEIDAHQPRRQKHPVRPGKLLVSTQRALESRSRDHYRLIALCSTSSLLFSFPLVMMPIVPVHTKNVKHS